MCVFFFGGEGGCVGGCGCGGVGRLNYTRPISDRLAEGEARMDAPPERPRCYSACRRGRARGGPRAARAARWRCRRSRTRCGSGGCFRVGGGGLKRRVDRSIAWSVKRLEGDAPVVAAVDDIECRGTPVALGHNLVRNPIRKAHGARERGRYGALLAAAVDPAAAAAAAAAAVDRDGRAAALWWPLW